MDIVKHSLQQNLIEISNKFKMNVPLEIIDYISSVIANYYKGFPYYLIDIKEKDFYRKHKVIGDISLLLVGFFKDWVNRRNRPTTEIDYINIGKNSYLNVYFFLEDNVLQ
ncbi:MAG: hypothetical protein GXO21_06475, partial [Aquificae bacterium]|nr:hypothetical protein [Aquificota bacterium]